MIGNCLDKARINNIEHLARSMASGIVRMPRNNVEMSRFITLDCTQTDNEIFKDHLSVKTTIDSGNGMHLVNTKHRTPLEVSTYGSLSEVMCSLMEDVLDDTVDFVDTAISKAHEILCDEFELPPLFLLQTDLKSVKIICEFLNSDTNLDRSIVEGIFSYGKSHFDKYSYFEIGKGLSYLSQSNFENRYAHVYNATPILKFISSFERRYIPSLAEVQAYHQHMELVRKYD